MGATRNTGYLENLIQYDASDNVAIATSVNPSYKVTLGGSMLGTTGLLNATSTQLVLQNVNGGTNAERIGMFMNSNDTFKILSLNDNNTTRVDNILVANVLNGNVGIGTASPGLPLDVVINSSTAYSSTSRANVIRAYNISTSANTFAGIELAADGASGAGVVGINGVVTGNGSGAMTFYTRDNSTFGERLRLTSAGDMYLTGRSTNGDYGMYFYSNDTDSRIYSSNSGAVSKSLMFYTSGTERMRITSGGDIYVNNGAALFFGLSAVTYLSGSTSTMTFAVNNAERMRITSGGNVGIGTTSPATGVKLDVNGVIRAGATKITSFSATVNANTTGNIDFNLNSILGTTGVPYGSGEIIVNLYLNGGTEGNEIYKITFGGYLDPAYTQNLAWGLSGTQVTSAGAITVNSLTLPSSGVIRLNVTNSATNAINAWATIMFFDGR